jgi:flap endonuclease-1
MGIKGLTGLIQKYAPNSVESVNLHTLSQKTLAIDASLFIYKMAFSVKGNKDGQNYGHIIGIFQKSINYLAVGIKPIYIFDGKPPKEKNCVLKVRRDKSEALKKLMTDSNDTQLKDKYKTASFRMTKDEVNDVKKLLSHMGISYIQAHGEAEGFASELCKMGYVDGVVTEDMDSLAFGTPILVRSNIDRAIKRKDVLSIITMEKVLEEMNVSFDEFLDICILSGCDYCENIKGIGPQKSYHNIKKHKNVEAFIATHKDAPPEYIAQVQKSRELFKIFDKNIQIDQIDQTDSLIDKDALRKYMVDMCGLSEKRFDNAMMKIAFK